MCHVPGVTCHVSGVKCHVSCVMCPVSYLPKSYCISEICKGVKIALGGFATNETTRFSLFCVYTINMVRLDLMKAFSYVALAITTIIGIKEAYPFSIFKFDTMQQ